MSIQTDDFAPARRVVSAAPASPNEEAIESALRPKGMREYVGQVKAREQLEIFIGAARKRGEAMDHVLLFGPPGLGKTTLSHIIANELGVNLRQTSGPVLEKPKDLAAILTNLEKNDVLFIDEIHRLSPVVEEILYPALEDYQIDIMIGEGPAARSIKLDLQPFTLVGATTRAGMLTNPLRDRFGIVARLEFYTPEELSRIVHRSAGLLKVPTDAEGAFEIARRSRGTPRIANRLLRRVRDYADVKGDGQIGKALAELALAMLDVDPQGFDVMDRKLLEAVIHRFDGGPVGLDNVAAAIGEEAGTIEDVIEPYLIQQGYLQRTPRGRDRDAGGVPAPGADAAEGERRRPVRRADARLARPACPAPLLPGQQFADEAAPERDDADDEDRADDHRDPRADAVGQVVLQADDREGAEHRAGEGAHAAEQRHQHHLARERPVRVDSVAKPEHQRLHRSGQAGERGGKHEGQQLVAVDVVAQRDGARFVLADRLQHLAVGRMHDADDEQEHRHEDRQHDVVHREVACQRESPNSLPRGTPCRPSSPPVNGACRQTK